MAACVLARVRALVLGRVLRVRALVLVRVLRVLRVLRARVRRHVLRSWFPQLLATPGHHQHHHDAQTDGRVTRAD